MAQALVDQSVAPGWYEDDVCTYQREARYPALFSATSPRNGIIYRRVRSSSGLISVAIRHDALSPAQRHALGEFRLHQYVLWHWYDVGVVSREDFATDPAFEVLPPDTIHLVVGTEDGRLLAYFSMQPAPALAPGTHAHWSPPWNRDLRLRIPSRVKLRMGDIVRPLFACERESYGPGVFGTLRKLRLLPVGSVRELPCLLRNHALQSPLSVLAVFEAIFIMSRVQADTCLGIQATLGIMDIEARRVTAYLGIPVLYAPYARVTRDELAYFWAEGMNDQGKFWPFVIATGDLLANPDHFQHLDTMLEQPLQALRRTLVLLRKTATIIEPEIFVSEPDDSPLLWTADPFYGLDERSGVPLSARVPVAMAELPA